MGNRSQSSNTVFQTMKAFFITFGLLCASAVQGNPWAKNCNNDGDCDEGFVCGGTNSMITTAWSGKCVRDGNGDGDEVMKKRGSRGGEACLKDEDCDEGMECARATPIRAFAL